MDDDDDVEFKRSPPKAKGNNLRIPRGMQLDVSKHYNMLKSWVNEKLVPAKMHVNSFETDLHDGAIIIKLLEIVTGEKVINQKSEDRMKQQYKNTVGAFTSIYKRENILMSLDFMVKKGIISKFNQISPEDIISGNLKMIITVVWGIIKWSDNKGIPEENSDEEEGTQGTVPDKNKKKPKKEERRSSDGDNLKMNGPEPKVPKVPKVPSGKTTSDTSTSPEVVQQVSKPIKKEIVEEKKEKPPQEIEEKKKKHST